jgi:hypothetical protein
MALFNLTDIKFNKNSETRGRLNDIVASEYQTNILKYPIDIGASYDKGHYMVIYINQQDNTAEEFRNAVNISKNDLPTVIESSLSIARRRGVSSTSGILNAGAKAASETLKNAEQNSSFLESTVSNVASKSAGNIFRRISRTTDAIALYMPDTLNFTHNQSYSDVAVFDTLGKLGTIAAAATAGKSLFDEFRETGTASINMTNVSSFILQAIRDFGGATAGNLATLGFAALGTASNPGLELLYSSPSFRSFRFDFMFYPRSQKEALEVMKIIDRLKFHQAPEIAGNAGGRFLIPPSEFDIKFYFNGKENPNIPKVSTCVLEQIDVDYAPNGFSAYEVPTKFEPELGGTGTPTGIRLSLQFKETQIITKEFLRTETYEVSGTAESTGVPPQPNIVGNPLPPLN